MHFPQENCSSQRFTVLFNIKQTIKNIITIRSPASHHKTISCINISFIHTHACTREAHTHSLTIIHHLDQSGLDWTACFQLERDLHCYGKVKWKKGEFWAGFKLRERGGNVLRLRSKGCEDRKLTNIQWIHFKYYQKVCTGNFYAKSILPWTHSRTHTHKQHKHPHPLSLNLQTPVVSLLQSWTVLVKENVSWLQERQSQLSWELVKLFLMALHHPHHLSPVTHLLEFKLIITVFKTSYTESTNPYSLIWKFDVSNYTEKAHADWVTSQEENLWNQDGVQGPFKPWWGVQGQSPVGKVQVDSQKINIILNTFLKMIFKTVWWPLLALLLKSKNGYGSETNIVNFPPS